MLRTEGGRVSTRAIEDALEDLEPLRHAVVFGTNELGADQAVAVVATEGDVPIELSEWNALIEGLDPGLRPAWVKRVTEIPMTVGFRPDKAALETAALDDCAQLLRYDPKKGAYQFVDTPGESLRA